MGFLVLEEMFPKLEGGLAHGAGIAFLDVGLLVPSEMEGPGESQATHVAFVGFNNSQRFLTPRWGARN
jgi:hypothetical protein